MRPYVIAGALILAVPAIVYAGGRGPAYPDPYPAPPPVAAPDPVGDEFTDSLPPPREIERAGDRMHRVLDALMGLDVGPIADAVDPRADGYRRHETLGDIGRRDDPYFDRRAHRSVDAMTDNMERLAGTMARV
ncbi:MAG: hypothetical protein ACM3YM_11905, partial [Sphingomonadales bacterium]